MNQSVTPLEQTFLDLVAIDEIHPHEHKVLEYITRRLDTANTPYQQDKLGTIVALIPGGAGEPLAFAGHVDIAAPLNGRSVIIESNTIKTDGTGLLGGDDKTAIAAMLELADAMNAGTIHPVRPVELIFTVGEEAGCVGAMALDMSLITAKQVLVFDWTGRINRIVTKSPAYIKIDVEYVGRTAHPAEWQKGKNAGAALIEAAGHIQQGEYAPGVTCNIGIMAFGQARNQIPGSATLQAELRSYDTTHADAAAAEIKQLLEAIAAAHGLRVTLTIQKDSPAYKLNQSGDLYIQTVNILRGLNLEPKLEPTYGCFDGNLLAAKGLQVMMIGAGYYSPHSPAEYVDRSELAELLEFAKELVAK